MQNDKLLKQVFLILLAIALFILSFLVLSPIIFSIILALLFAYLFKPAFVAIDSRIKHPNISTSILILAILIVIAVPIILITPILIEQTFETYKTLQNVNIVEPLQSAFPSLITPEISRTVSIQINNLIGRFFSSILNQLAEVIVDLPNLLLQLSIFFFTFFFAVRDSDKLKKYVKDLSPFSDETENKFSKEFRSITNAIIYGQVLIGIIQGLVLGLGMFIAGVPKALVLTLFAIILSIIPVLGSWLVWVPVSIGLLVAGNFFAAIFLALYGLIFVSTIDNILRPIFLSRNSNLPVALSIIGTLGGLYYFGIAGLVLGPLILAYSLILIEFYKQGKLKEIFR